MKTKSYIKSFILLLVLISAGSCSLNDFGDMNVDKKSPSQPINSYLLTNAIRYIPEALLMSNEPQVSFWMQYWTQIKYVAHEQYNFTENSFPFYQTVLVNLNYIIDQNTNEATKEQVSVYGDNNNQIAVARILKAYYFLSLTDRWGDIPYFEALRGANGGNALRPAVDKQKDVYYDLFKELKESVEQINENAVTPLKGDFLFNGNMMRWKKFANTTRMIMALRISNADPDKGKAEFNDALNASGSIIESNAENILYPFMDDVEGKNYNYMYNWNNSSSYPYALCKTLVDKLNALNDPRLPVYADKAAASNTYVGQEVATVGEQSQFSRMGVAMRQKNTPMYIYSYAQVLFSLSEAAFRGWIPGGATLAESKYYDAIKASFMQYNVFDADVFTAYTNLDEVKYSTDKALEVIGNQKWIALYPYGHEAWAEWRRLGFPVLTPAKGALSENGQIPRRFRYSIALKNLMPEQFAAVEERQPDKAITRIWWDANN